MRRRSLACLLLVLGRWLPTAADERGREIRSLAIHPDGTPIVTGRADGTVEVRERKAGAVQRSWKAHGAALRLLIFHPDGKRIVTLGAEDREWKDSQLRMWELAGARAVWSAPAAGVTALALHPRDARALSGTWQGAIALWDLEAGKELATLRKNGPRVGFLGYLAGGQRALVADDAGNLEIVEADGWKKIAAWGVERSLRPSLRDYVRAYAVTPDGRRAIAASENFRVWDLETRREVGPWKPDPSGIAGHFRSEGVAVSRDGRRAAAIRDHELRLVDLAGPRYLGSHTSDAFQTSVAFTPDGKQVLVGCGDGMLRLWDPVKGRVVATWK